MKERREFQRHRVSGNAEITSVVGTGSAPGERAKVVDCSLGGALLWVHSPRRRMLRKAEPCLTSKDSVNCVLRLAPDYDDVDLFADVVRSERLDADPDYLAVGLRFFHDVQRKSHTERPMARLETILLPARPSGPDADGPGDEAAGEPASQRGQRLHRQSLERRAGAAAGRSGRAPPAGGDGAGGGAPRASRRIAGPQPGRVAGESQRRASAGSGAAKRSRRLEAPGNGGVSESRRLGAPDGGARESRRLEAPGDGGAPERKSRRLEAGDGGAPERKSRRLEAGDGGERARTSSRREASGSAGGAPQSRRAKRVSGRREKVSRSLEAQQPAPDAREAEAPRPSGEADDVVAWARSRAGARPRASSRVAAEGEVVLRGSGVLADGAALIELPEAFADAVHGAGITVHLTPTDDCRGLFAAEKTPERVVVRELAGGRSSAEFDYLVVGRRSGYGPP